MGAFLCAFVLVATICVLYTRADVNLLTKKTPKGNRIIQKPSSATFHKFLRHTNAYVDKTLFIECVLNTLNDHRHIIITAPPRWGRSLNLKLLSFFLQIQLEENGIITPHDHTEAFGFFKRGELKNVFGSPDNFNRAPLVSNYPRLIRNNLAKYPVILLDFGGFNGLTAFKQYLAAFKSAMKNAFSAHMTAVVNLCANRMNIYGDYKSDGNCMENEFTRFNEILGKSVTDPTDLRRSVTLLSKLLNTSYEREAVVLIDNYDSFLHNCYTKQYGYLSLNETLDLEKFYLRFLRSVLESDHVHKVIMVGALPIRLEYGCAFDNVKYLRHTQIELYPFYGFSGDETDALLKQANIHETSARKARAVYDGYHIEKYPVTKIYNPSTIVEFINQGVLKSYTSNYSDTFVLQVLRNNKINDLLTELRGHQCLPYGPLEPQPFMNLRRLEVIRYNYNNDTASRDLLLWYLTAVGVLTVADTGVYCAKVPSFEFQTELNSILFGSQITYMYEPDAARALMQFVENKSDKVAVLLRYFKKMLIFDSQVDDWTISELELRLRFFDILHETNKSYGYEVATGESLKIKNSLFQPSMSISKKYVAVDTGKTRQMIKQSDTIIIQIGYQQTNNNLKRIFSQDLWPYCRAYFVRYPETKSLRLIAINVRDTLIIQYTNYSFADAAQVPSFKNVKMFEIDVEQV